MDECKVHAIASAGIETTPILRHMRLVATHEEWVRDSIMSFIFAAL
jgi:hypothetical protein